MKGQQTVEQFLKVRRAFIGWELGSESLNSSPRSTWSTLNFQPLSASYSYLANSPLLSQIVLTNNGQRRMTTTQTYDLANRLTSISSANPSGTLLSSFAYVNNSANQRTLRRQADGSYWRYEYDALGQVISGKKYWSDGTPVAGQQFEYAFDDIGNRSGTKAGGDENGAGLRPADYNANNLNQYTSRTIPGAVDVMGVSYATNTVTVNGQTAYRKGEYFRKEVSVANSSAPVWQSITVAATGQTTQTGNLLVPKASESFWHDLDGNLLSDSLWTNTWNAENRMIRVQSAAGVSASGARMREEWTHLPDGRWIERIVSTNNGSAYYPAYTNRFLWSGQVLLAILDHTNGVVMSFLRGLDMSGSIQGAGGVGGVLAVNFAPSTLNPQPSTHVLSYDGNGNVAAMHNAADGIESAVFDYGPFSEPIRVTGPVSTLMPLRFSTMYEDNVTGDRKYLFRDYTPGTGRWKSRDPIGERGFELRRKRALPSLRGFNAVSRDKDPAYTLLLNNVPNDIDLLGLCDAYCNKCGEDVTLSIFQTLDDIRQTYEDASWWSKRMALYYMFTFSSMESWDIRWLKNYTSDRWMGCNVQSVIRGCYETVTFEGKCVSIHELNYIMYGWAALFTTLSEYDARKLIYIAQVGLFFRFGDDPATLARKVGFAEYGAQLYPLSPAWLAWPHQCEIDLGRKDVDIHDWIWRGLKEE